jgi:predicted site-specific integrase-resolvase
MGVSYKTAWRWWRAGRLDAYQAATGTVIVREPAPAPTHPPVAEGVAVYARVSAAENRPHLEGQAERLVAYCAAKGYQVHQVVKEVGSGVKDSRPKFLKLLADPSITVIVVEHHDRATRFGFRYLETLLERQGRRVEVVNLADYGDGDGDGREDLVADLVAIVDSFCARLYGQRRAKRKTETIVRELTELMGQEAPVTEEQEQEEVAQDATR